jgi:malonyl-CoA O-methyltransferase
MIQQELSPLFVTGTDTGVGKTFVSACLMQISQAHYWKPFQTGDDDDTRTVQRLAGCDAQRIHRPYVSLAAPLSPLHAAEREGVLLDPESLPLPKENLLIIEGAGGVMVPLTPNFLMIDLMARWEAKVLVVARSTLGTINHTLLTLRALKERSLSCLGVVMVGPSAPHNVNAIEDFGYVPVLATLPWYESEVGPENVKESAPTLKRVFDAWGYALARPEIEPAVL